MRRTVLPVLVLLALFSTVHGEVTIVSADAAAEVDLAPDRQFPCESLPWTDPDDPLPEVVFYRAIGATGQIRVRRSGSAIEVWSESESAPAPATARSPYR